MFVPDVGKCVSVFKLWSTDCQTIWWVSFCSLDLWNIALADEVASWTSPEDIQCDTEDKWLCKTKDPRTQRKPGPLLTKGLHRFLPHRNGRGEYFNVSVLCLFSCIFQWHMSTDSWYYLFLSLIERGQRFWFWFKQSVFLRHGPVWCWNWNYHQYSTLGTVVHDLLPSHTRWA